MVVFFINTPKGGGAEFLVKSLNRQYLRLRVPALAYYFKANSGETSINEKVLGWNPRNPINIFRLWRLISKLKRESKTGLTVHAHLTWPFYFVGLASIGIRGVKFIYTEHHITNKRRNIPLLWIFERFVYNRYDKIICISDGVYKSLASWVGRNLIKKLIVIYNGARIYELSARSHLSGRKPRLVSVGSLTRQKNFQTCIKAVSDIRDKIEAYVIVGDGEERSSLEDLIESLGLESVVQLVGWSDDVGGYLMSSDVQLIPSVWEGFGLVAVEGMSTGLPVVASNISGLREVLGRDNPAVIFVNHVTSPEYWRAGILEAIDQLEKDDQSQIAAISRARSLQFSLDLMAEKYLDVYKM